MGGAMTRIRATDGHPTPSRINRHAMGPRSARRLLKADNRDNFSVWGLDSAARTDLSWSTSPRVSSSRPSTNSSGS